MRQTELVEPGADPGSRPNRDSALHDEDGPSLELRKLVDDPPDRAQVGVARVERRRADTNEHDTGGGECLLRVERVAEPLAVSRKQLFELRLVNRHVPPPERADPLRVDVTDDDLVAELSEAAGRDEADPSCAEYADRLLCRHVQEFSGVRLVSTRATPAGI